MDVNIQLIMLYYMEFVYYNTEIHKKIIYRNNFHFHLHMYEFSLYKTVFNYIKNMYY